MVASLGSENKNWNCIHLFLNPSLLGAEHMFGQEYISLAIIVLKTCVLLYSTGDGTMKNRTLVICHKVTIH
jgi:hypothetical protein